MDALAHSAARLRQWCIEKALPIWAERAQRPDGSWVEHLNLDGTADIAAERRWRVLARQVYVYAKATSLGWFDGEDIAVKTYNVMTATGYVHRVCADGKITNDIAHLLGIRPRIFSRLLRFAQLGRGDHLHSARDLLRIFYASDPVF